MANRASTPLNVDQYIAPFAPQIQAVLQQVRQVVRDAAPVAKEVISYQMPALKQNGSLVYFAAFKKHIGFYPPIKGDARLEKAAATYVGEKGNLRLPIDKPMPFELIRGPHRTSREARPRKGCSTWKVEVRMSRDFAVGRHSATNSRLRQTE